LNKRGSLLDHLYIPIILFFTAIIIIIAYLILNVVQDGFYDGLAGTPDVNRTMVNDLFQKGIDGIKLFDTMFIIFLAGLSMAVLISAYYVDTNAAFFWVSIFLLLVLITLSAIFSNAYETFRTTAGIATLSDGTPIADAFTKMNFVMSNMPLYILVMILLGIIVFYAKRSSGGGGIAPY